MISQSVKSERNVNKNGHLPVDTTKMAIQIKGSRWEIYK